MGSFELDLVEMEMCRKLTENNRFGVIDVNKKWNPCRAHGNFGTVSFLMVQSYEGG
jgi:hypothetical protein